ncbi:MAG: GNAT family N-acetyltransferase [Acidimicrobiia bacterium]
MELSAGWARAQARPWNEDVPAASLRLERGGARFLTLCAELLSEWNEEVRSPATLPGTSRVWREAGFEESGRLILFEHPLTALRPAEIEVDENLVTEIAELNRIDRESFPAPWRLGPLGLAESLAATSRAVTHTVSINGRVAGFAVTGTSLAVGYLQRLAVDPAAQRQGVGRALVRASLLWARKRRAVSLLVNTQPDNEPAAALYRNEGFDDVPAGLQLWRFRKATRN